MSDTAQLREAIVKRLAPVIDPETGADVIRMRLIEDLAVDDNGRVSYKFRPSSPFLDHQTHGVFATRYPRRPNPIGISVVELPSRHENGLEIKGVDVLAGTPLLDIKPYVPDFDVRTGVRTGCFERRTKD